MRSKYYLASYKVSLNRLPACKNLKITKSLSISYQVKMQATRDFPRGAVAKAVCSQRTGPGSIPGQGTRSHMLQLRVCMPQLKIPHAATKDPHTQQMKIPCVATRTQRSRINIKYIYILLGSSHHNVATLRCPMLGPCLGSQSIPRATLFFVFKKIFTYLGCTRS